MWTVAFDSQRKSRPPHAYVTIPAGCMQLLRSTSQRSTWTVGQKNLLWISVNEKKHCICASFELPRNAARRACWTCLLVQKAVVYANNASFKWPARAQKLHLRFSLLMINFNWLFKVHYVLCLYRIIVIHILQNKSMKCQQVLVYFINRDKVHKYN